MSKKIICLILIVSLALCAFPLTASSEVSREEIGVMKISKVGGIWTEPTANNMILIRPGSTAAGMYYNRISATYDASAGGYVVTRKIPAHCSGEIPIGANSIGLCLSYTPGSSTGASFSRENFLIWQRIRVGDVLTLSGVDVAAGTIETSGVWGDGSFVSNANISVTAVRDSADTVSTGYSGMTVLAYGDSLTANGGWTESVSDALGVNVINSGVSGDSAREALVRFDSYVTPFSPGLVLLMYGTNDCLQFSSSAAVNDYRTRMTSLVNRCKALGAKVVLMKPNDFNFSVFDDGNYASGSLQLHFESFLEAIDTVAAQTGCGVIDLNSEFDSVVLADYMSDNVHPNAQGYKIFSDTITSYLQAHESELADAPKIDRDPTDLRFNDEDINSALFVGENNLTLSTVSHTAFLEVSGEDPYVTVDYSRLSTVVDADLYGYVVLTYMVPDNNTSPLTPTQVFYRCADAPGVSESASFRFTPEADGRYHSHITDLSSDAMWTGELREMRIDPFAQAADKDGMHIAAITLCKTQAEAQSAARSYESIMNAAEQELSIQLGADFTGAEAYLYGMGQNGTRLTLGENGSGVISLTSGEGELVIRSNGMKLVCFAQAYPLYRSLGIISSGAAIVLSDTSVFELAGDTIVIPLSTTARQASANFTGEVRIADKNGVELVGDVRLGTGCTVTRTGDSASDTVSVIVPADLHGDGVVNGKDIVALRKQLASPGATYERAADANSDGITDTQDLAFLLALTRRG